MANSNNPAGRFYNLLHNGKKPSYRKNKVREVWANLLGVPANDSSMLLVRLGKIMAIPSQIESKINQEENIDHSVYLKWLPKVNKAFRTLNLEANWSTFIDPIDEAVLYGLEICSEQLARKQPESVIKEEALKDIKNEVEGLLKEIRSSNIDSDLKNYLIGQLENIINSIYEYDFAGVVPLQKAFESTVGSISLHPELHEKIKKTNYSKKFWTVMRRVALVLAIAVGGIQIGKDTVALLAEPHTVTEDLHKKKSREKIEKPPNIDKSNDLISV